MLETALNISNLVDEAFRDCEFRKSEDDDKNKITVEGLRKAHDLNSQRLENNRELVKELVDRLPVKFKKENGIGLSFLKLNAMQDGERWTNSYAVCEKLMVMAIGLKLMNYVFPKKDWRRLPGKVPYVVIE